MKKFAIALTMALMGAGILPLSMNAQENNTQTSSTQTEKTECQKKEAKCCGKDGEFKAEKGKFKTRHHGDKKVGKGKKGSKERMNPMAGINLTDAQKDKLKELRKEQKASVEKIDKEARAKKEKARAEFDKDLKKVLTPEQYAQYEANKAKAQEMRTAKKANKESGKPMAKDGKKGKHGKQGKKA